MPTCQANGIELFYDEFGSPTDPVILLIMGLATQMIAWPEEFCNGLASHGFRVIRFDNRDIGLSQKMHGVKPPNMVKLGVKFKLGLRSKAPYDLEDMAKDAIGLLDALAIPKAHIVGVSMGGMIAQILSYHHSSRVLSLTSIMSTTGNAKLTSPHPSILKKLFLSRPKSNDIEHLADYAVGLWSLIEGNGYTTPKDVLRERIKINLQRSHYPKGFPRQLAAILAAGDRTQKVKSIKIPTLIIHGDDDRMVSLAAGKETARCIQGSQLEIIPGMGHYLSRPLLPQLVSLISTHTQRNTVQINQTT